jgi:hypothetical protein
MTTAKVDIKIGALSFSGEGDKEWLTKQLDKFIQHAPALLQITPAHSGGAAGEGAHREAETHTHRPATSGKAGTLAAFLTSKNAKKRDSKKFLAAAAWLHAGGKERLTPTEVNDALDKNNQGKVTNPALVLSRHVAKGSCERSGDGFYVTEEGQASLK